MADLGGIFDPTEVPQSERSFDPLPEGDYVCQVIESDVVPTKAGGGDEILKLTIEVMEGRYEHRRIFENLNYRNRNPTAQGIAQEALRDLCFACGLGPIGNSELLHFRPFVARIVIEQDKTGRYAPKNRVKAYKSHHTALPTGKAAAGRPTSAQNADSQSMKGEQPSDRARHSAPGASHSKAARPWNRPAA